jgi:hypothetical protein
MKGFVIVLSGFPAAKDDPNPFERQNADGAVVAFALLALRLVEGFGPFGTRNRLGCELVKGLAEELWAEDSTMYPAGFPTTL